MLNNFLLKAQQNLTKNHSLKFFFRTYANVLSKQFDVSQFCTVAINCPYNINIKPIDVFESQQKVFLNLNSNSDLKLTDVQCKQDGDTVSVDIPAIASSEDHTLNIEASVKANLNVCGRNGNVIVGSFYGKYIDVKTNEGDINLSKSQCESVSLITNGGNVHCKDVIQAADITLTTKSGNIITDRLQGLRLKVNTSKGHINTGSSYCDNSIFETDSGQLTLQNLHKHVTIKINVEGLLNMNGFDGELFVYIKKGLADIQISKLYKESQIVFEDQSSLILRLSEECQKENLISILTKNYVISDTVKMKCNQQNNYCELLPQNENALEGRLTLKCENSHVLVDSASWRELFKASIKKRT